MDHLTTLDDETFATVIAIHRIDLAEEKALLEDGQIVGTNVFKDNVNGLELQLDEIEKQRAVAHDARLAQSIINAKLSDITLIAEISEQEQQDQEDREHAQRLANPNDERSSLANETDALSRHENALEKSSTPFLSKLAGRWVSERAGLALYPDNESNDFNPETDKTAPDLPRENCLICTEDLSYFDAATLPCGHNYCRDCLHRLFNNSFTDESLFPPRCCQQGINVESVEIFMTRELIEQLDEKTIEHNTEDKTYCANTSCNAFVPPASISNNVGVCQKCGTQTCSLCKDNAHDDECQENANTKATLALAQQEGWQRCRRCKAVIELRLGCNHITCKCGNEFCYVCGAQPWKSCECAQWDENRLLDRAQQIAGREEIQGLNAVAQVRDELQGRHNCDHRYWRSIDGGRCSVCRDVLPNFLYRCSGCNLEVCRDCRHNRL